MLLVALLMTGCGNNQMDPVLGNPGAGAAPTVTATVPTAAEPAVTGVSVDTAVTATFSKAMVPATVNGTSFTLACPAGTPVEADVAYDAATQMATLTPRAALAAGTTCGATITTALTDTAGFALASNVVWSFTTAAADPTDPPPDPVDTTRPTVLLTVPVAGASAAPPNTRITASFSEAMNSATLSNASFTVTNTTLGTPVAGSVSYSSAARTATFTPTAPATLAVNSNFRATITTAATDVAGNAIAGNAAVAPAAGAHVWLFSTAVAADTTRPTVVLTVPVAGAPAAPRNTRLTATFSEEMDGTTLTDASFTVTDMTLGLPVAGSVSYSTTARTATFAPSALTALAASSNFRATISTAVTDVAGNGIAGNTAVLPAAGAHVWLFSTAAAGDLVPPVVTAISPAIGSTSCRNRPVAATFSEPMDPATLTATTLRVTDNGVAVAGTVGYDPTSQVASFTATDPAGFASSRPFVVTVVSGAAGVKDLAGNALAVDRTWSFNTNAQPCQAAVDLRSAAAFGSFGGGAGVTNQGTNTVVNGDVGTTAACTLITGFHDSAFVYTETPLNVGTVNGSISCAPPAPGTALSMAIATQARADALTAYNELATMPAGSDPGAGQLGGQVLAPATYTSAGGAFEVTTGNLTLDAQGDPNAVWVFQSAGALTVGLPATPRQVLLINGAQAKNVFWQVGSAARIEDGSSMVGTIIAPAGVTVSTAGQTVQTFLTGRAIGLTASVTLVNTTIVAP